jgi:hypothetical protein
MLWIGFKPTVLIYENRRWHSEYYLDRAVTVFGRYFKNHVQTCSGVNTVSHQVNNEV